MLIHSGDKPHKCGTCGKAFTVKSSLNNHVLIHILGDKPHECHICGTVFAQKSSLLRHLRTHQQYSNVQLIEKCQQ